MNRRRLIVLPFLSALLWGASYSGCHTNERTGGVYWAAPSDMSPVERDTRSALCGFAMSAIGIIIVLEIVKR